MQIAEASKASGLSVDTIRYYEKSGLLPDIDRSASGNRQFSAKNIEWLTLLYWLRETGMPMKQMHLFASLYIAGDETIPQRKQILLAHADHLKQRREALDRCEEVLSYKLAMYEKYEGASS